MKTLIFDSIMEPQINSTPLKQIDTLRYAVITPVRNESEYIEKTIRSMIQQTVRPTEWIVVNDGSSDNTAEIVSKYSKAYSWIKLLNRIDRGTRQRGKGVVETFYTGYQALTQDYEVIVKLDGDLFFEPDFFQTLLNEFAINPKLGITGGAVYERLDGENWILQAKKDHVRGPNKIYRRTCFEAIGGLKSTLGWDGIDQWEALSLGWEVKSFLNLKVLHYRWTGAATGFPKNKIEQGYGAYYMGSLNVSDQPIIPYIEGDGT
ncbi:MAG: glycosyltransferase, partial [Ginsengibacter sp.]